MPHYRSVGDVPPKRHTQHRTSAGRLLREELVGEEGFSSDSSLLYHRGVPAAITASEVWDLGGQGHDVVPNHPLRPRHLRLPDLFADEPAADLVTGRRLVLGNGDVRLASVEVGHPRDAAPEPSPLYRNATGDEVAFVRWGRGTVETVFGALDYGPGDFVVLPRATTHRWVPHEATALWVIEANSHVGPPKRYLSKHGQLLEHAPYCERDLRAPVAPLVVDELDQEADVLVKHRAGGRVVGTRLTTATHPFDVVGWDGCLYPWTLSVHDFEPITGRIHQPPPVHQVLEGWGFVVCAFVPRKVDYHPLAVPVPYYHSNVDSDEVMLYVDGDYEARKGSGIGIGSVSLHPGGHAHGPQPSAIEASLGAERFEELAVMVDTFAPLGLGEGGLAVDDPSYATSWARDPLTHEV